MPVVVGTFIVGLAGGAVLPVAGAPLVIADVAGASFLVSPLVAGTIGTIAIAGGLVGSNGKIGDPKRQTFQ